MLVEGGLTLCRKRAHDEDDHEGLTPEQAADMAPEED